MVTIILAAGLAACGTTDGGSGDARLATAPPAQTANGPRADYPITIGEPYFVNGVEYEPADVMNYDHVGYLTADTGVTGYTASHHTLPLPSYVEVTSLDTGRTILARVERRGPMNSNDLLGLSPAAMTQLGATIQTPVRVRRVNPPEDHRFLLRAGDAAPLRMDTPASLLTVLQRRVPENGAASLRGSNTSAPDSASIETVELAASEATPAPAVPAPDRDLPEVAEAAPAAAVSPAATSSDVPPSLPPLEPASAPPSSAAGEFAAAFEDEPTEPEAAPVVVAEAEPEPVPVPPAADGRFVVQAAAFSTRERAERVANVIGGAVSQSGRYYRVRTGPFATRGEAEASLANVRRAGYTDARIFTGG